jgi:uncharacterized protein YndB with AHSA1/START domain
MVTAEKSVGIDKPTEEVFAFVSDPVNEPKWHTDVVEVSPPAGGVSRGATMTWTVKAMGRKDLDLEVLDYVPNEREQLQAKAPLMGMRPTITYLFEPSGTGTKFTRRVDAEVTGAWKLFGPLMGSMVSKRNTGFVDNLKKVLEQ